MPTVNKLQPPLARGGLMRAGAFARMIVENDTAIEVNDGSVLRANVFRPESDGRHPVVLVHGVYGKDVHFRDAFPKQWDNLHADYPGFSSEGTSGRFLRWETVDPERWVPDGYVVIHVDARGAGKSAGLLDPLSPRDIQDYHDVIEWAAVQPWSNGRVGTIGVSYYAISQWRVAALQPKGHAAMIAWEGSSEPYREMFRHGGILSNTFWDFWWQFVLRMQHGFAGCPYPDATSSVGRANGNLDLSDEQLKSNRVELCQEIASRRLDCEWFGARRADLRRVDIPLLSAGNWGGAGLHLRGNVEGFLKAGSRHKWLSMHTGTHYTPFYLPESVALQKQFFGHFLRDEANGWPDRERVSVAVRHPDGDQRRSFDTFPPRDTRALSLHLHAGDQRLQEVIPDTPGEVRFKAGQSSLHFRTAPMDAERTFCGYAKLGLTLSSTTEEADLFVALQVFRPDGSEWTFDGAHDRAPLSRGWLRSSQRASDPSQATPLRVVHTHSACEPLTPGALYDVEVEIWPFSIVLPPGYSLGVTIAGSDIPVDGMAPRHSHSAAGERDSEAVRGTTCIHTGPASRSVLALPLLESGNGA